MPTSFPSHLVLHAFEVHTHTRILSLAGLAHLGCHSNRWRQGQDAFAAASPGTDASSAAAAADCCCCLAYAANFSYNTASFFC